MWYQKIVEAGALDELAGGIDPNKSPEEVLRNIRPYTEISRLPNSEHLYKYISDLIDSGDKNYLISYALENMISIYSRDPEHVHKANRLIPLLSKYCKLNNITNKTIVPDNFSTLGSTINTHNQIYNLGYGKLLGALKEGLSLSKQIELNIMLNLDLKSSISMEQNETRKQIKQYLKNEKPIYELIDADIYSGDQIIDNVINDIYSQPNKNLFLDIANYSGIPFKDYLHMFQRAKEEDVMDGIPIHAPLLRGGDLKDFITYLDNNKPDFTENLFKELYVNSMRYALVSYDDDFWHQQSKKYPAFFAELYQYAYDSEKPSLHKIGVGPKDAIIATYLEMYNQDPARADSEMFEKPSQEDIEAYKAARSQPSQPSSSGTNLSTTPITPTTNQTSAAPTPDIFQKHIADGDIVKLPVSGEYEKLIDDILHSFGFGPDDQSMVDDIKNRLKIYVFNNNEFYIELAKSAFGKYEFINPKLGQACGYFHPSFKDNNNGPSIFLNKYISESYVETDNIIKNLGITADMISLSTAAHEIAHLADYVIKGGPEVFRNVDPKNSLKQGEVYNSSRLYLSDIREIVARVYGNTSYMIELLHNRIEEMRTSEIVRKAAMEELSEMLMSNEASWLNATPMVSEPKLQEWAEKRFGPYEHSEQPYTQATEDFMRQKQIALKFYEDAGKVNREDIKKETIEEIDSLKEQAEILKSRVSEDSEEYKQLQQDIKKLEYKIKNIEAGMFDHDISVIIKSVASYIAFKDLKISNEIAADPNFVSPISIRKEQMAANIVGDTTPLSYQELKTMRDFDLNQVAQGTEGGKTLKEEKPSFMSYDIYNPKWREEYPDTFK
jgi:hypothetical protein